MIRTRAERLSCLGSSFLGLIVGGTPDTARADDPTYTIAIEDNKFDPAAPTVPAGTKVMPTSPQRGSATNAG